MALYARSSVVALGADFTFPTPVTTYDCVDPATLNLVPGGGHFVHDALRAQDPTGAKWRGARVVNGVTAAAPASKRSPTRRSSRPRSTSSTASASRWRVELPGGLSCVAPFRESMF